MNIKSRSVTGLYDKNKAKEIKDLHDFFEHGKLYYLSTIIPIYKNKECFELKTWSWFNCEESSFLDLKNVVNNTILTYTASNRKNPTTVITRNNSTAIYGSSIKRPNKVLLFVDFVKNSDNITGANDKTSIVYHPFPSIVRSLSHAVCLKFLYEAQIIYVPVCPGQQNALFCKQEI